MVPRAPHPSSQSSMNGTDGMGGYGHHHHHHHHTVAAAAYRTGMSQRLGGATGGGPPRHTMTDYVSSGPGASAYRTGPSTQSGMMAPPPSASIPPTAPYGDAPSSSHHLTSLTALLNSSTTASCCKYEEEMDTSGSLLSTGMAPPCVTLDEVSCSSFLYSSSAVHSFTLLLFFIRSL